MSVDSGTAPPPKGIETTTTGDDKKYQSKQKLASVPTDPTQFDAVFSNEWKEINRRREECRQAGYTKIEYAEKPGALRPSNLVGLALSGGGIRSATFCLGLLQGLHQKNLLQAFDYLSTVSGGGYVGGWWSAWLAREKEPQPPNHIFPSPERLAPDAYTVSDAYAVPDSGAADKLVANPQTGEPVAPMTQVQAAQSECVGQERIPDLFSAGTDPIHHLRLFGNYLTPRKGALSADTWRAVTTISRNMLLTWLILLPLLVAAIIVGQLYFVLQSGSYDGSYSTFFFADPEVTSLRGLTARLWLVAKPLLGIILWIVALICAWMVNSGEAGKFRNRIAGTVGAVVVVIFFAMLSLSLYSYAERPSLTPYVNTTLFVWAVLGVGLVGYACLPIGGAADDDAIRRRREVRRNRIVRVHAKLLVLLIATAFVLLFAGFGHELVNYLNSPTGILKYVTKAGGWGAVLLSIGGSIYTALKTAPTGGHDPREATKTTLFNRIVFAVTPPLVLVVLAVLVSWGVNILFSHINRHYIFPPSGMTATGAAHDPSLTLLFTTTTCAGIVLSLFFALLETKWRCHQDEPKCRAFRWLVGLLVVLTVLLVIALVNVGALFFSGSSPWLLYRNYGSWNWLVLSVALIAHAGASLIIFKRLAEDQNRKPRLGVYGWLLIGLGWLALTLLAFSSLKAVLFTQGSQVPYGTPRVLYFSLIICFVFALLEQLHGWGSNKRALSLLAAVYFASFVLLLFSWIGDGQMSNNSDAYRRLLIGQLAFGLLGMLLTWVVAFGWMADPNALSLHLFYKSRLVRAYLGASNPLRREKEVTEAAEQDNMPLHTLKNCERGAPFHLINTTLNLVGGRDLATAQRSSANFTLSKFFCGSTRTGYRPTGEYMGGRMTLGTAVAISGAAASPNMGAMTLTSSLAMLMTLLNVRLGFWAPTPNKNGWREPSARLWPFYVLREFLSQTNDLSAYCYLTDGGHFDNTGLYSLVERGCRYIVVADCGADPRPCFQDLGTAIRRCRIDFNTEIKLDISQLERAKEKGSLPEGFVVVGTIKYDERHLRSFSPRDWRDTPEGKKLIEIKTIQEYVKEKGEPWVEERGVKWVEEKGAKWLKEQSKLWLEEKDTEGKDKKWIKENWKTETKAWVEKHCNGRIIVFKPALTNVKKETPDVRQYGLENDGFPQQSTADLWYDEAQFESYRRLGQTSAEKFFNDNRLTRASRSDETLNLDKLFDDLVKPG